MKYLKLIITSWICLIAFVAIMLASNMQFSVPIVQAKVAEPVTPPQPYVTPVSLQEGDELNVTYNVNTGGGGAAVPLIIPSLNEPLAQPENQTIFDYFLKNPLLLYAGVFIIGFWMWKFMRRDGFGV